MDQASNVIAIPSSPLRGKKTEHSFTKNLEFDIDRKLGLETSAWRNLRSLGIDIIASEQPPFRLCFERRPEDSRHISRNVGV